MFFLVGITFHRVAAHQERVPVSYGSIVKINQHGKFSEKIPEVHFLVDTRKSWDHSGNAYITVAAPNTAHETTSMWLIQSSTSEIASGLYIKCGDKISLQNIGTGNYLHIRNSNGISGEKQATTSTKKLTNFIIMCPQNKEDKLVTGDHFALQVSGYPLRYIHTDLDEQKRKFTNQNCPGCGLSGSFEISATESDVHLFTWSIEMGLLIDREQSIGDMDIGGIIEEVKGDDYNHDEL